MRTGLVANAAGSAFVEQGRTKVIATVYGPRELPRETASGLLTVDVRFAPFSQRGLKPQDNEKRVVLYTSLLKGALSSVICLEKYGTSALDVSLLVLEDHGCVLTAALGAASLALANAGIETSDIAAGATVHLAKAVGGGPPTLLIDCDGDEERSLAADSAVLHAGLCPETGRLCLLHSAGTLPPEGFEQMVLLAKDAAEALGQEMRKCLAKTSERRDAKRQRLESALAAGAGTDLECSDDEVL